VIAEKTGKNIGESTLLPLLYMMHSYGWRPIKIQRGLILNLTLQRKIHTFLNEK